VTASKPLRVLADPRLPEIAAADYAEQLRVGIAIRDSLNAAILAVETLRSVRDQATSAVEQAGRLNRQAELKPAADSLLGKVSAVENEINQTKSKSGQDPIRFAGKLDNQLAELYGFVTGTDGYIAGGAKGRPTRGAMLRFDDLAREMAAVTARYRAVIDQDVARFNELLRRLGLGPILLPNRPVT
jgi:hypothetical protein